LLGKRLNAGSPLGPSTIMPIAVGAPASLRRTRCIAAASILPLKQEALRLEAIWLVPAAAAGKP